MTEKRFEGIAAGRNPGIDLFRGIAIVLMVFFNYTAGISWFPWWLRHAPDIGFTLTDLVAPLFIFAIALSFGDSWRRKRIERGPWKTGIDFVRRYAAIAGIGAILAAGEVWTGEGQGAMNWGVLQAIGAAGLIALIFVRFTPPVRIIAGCAILVVYQILLDRFWLGSVLSASHGGIPGSIAWGGMLVISSGMLELCGLDTPGGGDADSGSPAGDRLAASARPPRGVSLPLRDIPEALIPVGFLVAAAGIVTAFVTPVSKNRVSLSYILLATGLSAVVYGLCSLAAGKQGWGQRSTGNRGAGKRESDNRPGVTDARPEVADTRSAGRRRPILRFFVWWGANPLLLYILHLLFLGAFVFSDNPLWYVSVHPVLALIQFTALIGVLTGIARSLYIRGKFFTF